MFITRLKMLLRTLENHGMPQNTHNKTCLEFLVLKFLNTAISETRGDTGAESPAAHQEQEATEMTSFTCTLNMVHNVLTVFLTS